jgi:hypothetical protein
VTPHAKPTHHRQLSQLGADKYAYTTTQLGSRPQQPIGPQVMDSLRQRLLIYPVPLDQNKRFAGGTMCILSHELRPDPTATCAHHFTMSIFPEPFLLCDFRPCSKGPLSSCTKPTHATLQRDLVLQRPPSHLRPLIQIWRHHLPAQSKGEYIVKKMWR